MFSPSQSGVDDPNFAYDLLTELTRTFLAYADNVRAQDSAAYAIQVNTQYRDEWFLSFCSFALVCVFADVFVVSSGAAVHLRVP